MHKKLLKQLITYGGIFLSWAIFCICNLANIQLRQREKAYAQTIPPEIETYTEIPTWEPTTLEQPTNVVVEETQPVETTTEEETTEVVPSYSQEDLLLLAQLIESEGGIESYECKLYIGSVVLNRVNSTRFPNTLKGVIFQADKSGVHQFSVTKVRADGTRAIDCTPRPESYQAAEYLLTYGTQLPDDVLVFYADYCKEPWVTSRAKYTQVDTTVFAFIYSE